MKKLSHRWKNNQRPDDSRNNDPDIEANVRVKKSVFVSAAFLAITVAASTYFAAYQPTPDIEYSNEPSPTVVAPAKSSIKRSSVAEAEAAKRATYDRAIEWRSGYCSRAVRQVVAKNHGSKYAYLFGASAKDSANLFLKYGYGYLWPRDKEKLGGTIQPGDILFKRYVAKSSKGEYFGHVGIYTGNNLVWENSSTTKGRLSGAKGYRTLAQYGAFDVVGRLPAPAIKTLAARAKK